MPKMDFGKSRGSALIYSPPIILVNFRRDYGVSMEWPKARPNLLRFLNQFCCGVVYICWNDMLTP